MFALRREDRLGRFDLRANPGKADRRGHDVRGEREPRGLELVGLVVDLRGEAFELAPRAAENVERVRDVGADAVDGERPWIRRLREPDGRRIDSLTHDAGGRIDRRELRGAGARGVQLARLGEPRTRLIERRAVSERAADERVEFGRAEQRPPFGGNVAVRARLDRQVRRRTRYVTIDRRRIRRAKVGTDGAAGAREGEQQGERALQSRVLR